MFIKTPILSITKPIILGLVICLLTLTISKPASAEIEPLPEHLVTDDIKLLYYYIFLSEYKILDLLTETEIATIISELKQFQPETLNKLLHHDAETFQAIETNISEKQLPPKSDSTRYHLNYKYGDTKYKISFSPTIEQVWLRFRTEESNNNLFTGNFYNSGPLFTFLGSTANNNIIPLIQFFLDEGIDVNIKNQKWGTTIFSSVGTLEIAQLLLANGADPTIVSNKGATPLIYAIFWERSNELIKFLIDIGVDLHAKDPLFGTALDTAKDQVGYSYKDYNDMGGRYNSDEPEWLKEARARIAKAEEVVRIIEQALADEAK